MTAMQIPIGTRFHFLTTIGAPFRENRQTRVAVRCDCGTEKIVRAEALLHETTKSCGCYNNKLRSERMTKMAKKYTAPTDHPLYNSYKRMKIDRYYNGTEICSEWDGNYQAFYEWAIDKWTEKKVLSRKDLNGPFSPQNCIITDRSTVLEKRDWATSLEKTKKTSLSKYGVEFYVQTDEYKERVKQISLERYGVDHHSKAEQVKARVKATCLEKYGETCSLKSQEVKDKIKATNIERYGVPYTSWCPEIRQKQVESILNKYGTYFNRTNLTQENSLKEFIESLGFITSTHILKEGKELDIIVNDFAFEYCGLYWHTELSPTPRTQYYHYNKMIAAKEEGFRLITIFSDEWIYRKQQVKSRIKSILGINSKVYARETEYREIDELTAKLFIDEYHIQDLKRKPIKCVGLYKDELLAVATFNKHHRNQDEIVMDRLCFKDGVSIVGGLSKILAHCGMQFKTWSDNRWSDGLVYEKAGMKLVKELKPDYAYVLLRNPKKRIPKQSAKKSVIECPEDITEVEFMEQQGYARIWDCGKKLFIKD